eukprot:206857-Prymnesium_polylepis.1
MGSGCSPSHRSIECAEIDGVARGERAGLPVVHPSVRWRRATAVLRCDEIARRRTAAAWSARRATDGRGCVGAWRHRGARLRLVRGHAR